LQKALSLARQGKRQEALELADSMGKPVSGIPYTSDGLETFLGQARVQYQLGILAGWCGQEEQARKQWQAAAQARGGRQAPYALLAARRLGKVDTAAWEKRLGEALQELEDYTAGGGHFPGSAVFSQGMILQLLGRSEEATEKLRQVFYLPDKGMSHYLAREALRKVPSPSP
jgi:tetratricopeptide (TPR) repeat protein